jgi:arylformamidase
MKIIDVSLAISPEMPVWPGNPSIVLDQFQSIGKGAHVNETRMSCSVHSLTHVDAPHHFLNDNRTVESLPLEVLVGPVQVIAIPDQAGMVSASILGTAPILPGTKRILIKTRNSNLWRVEDRKFHEDFVALTPDGAEWLVDHEVLLIGVDYLSVAQFKQGGPTHRILLSAGIVIVEGLDLSAVEPGCYDFVCLPLKISGSDGAPARAILIK